MSLSKFFRKLASVFLTICFLASVFFPAARVNAGMAKGEKFLGNIISSSVPSNFGTYWNQVTPENASKWGSVESSRDNMNWGNVDLIYNYCKTNGIPFKFHTLVWGNQEPGWIDSLSAEDQKAEVLEWIQAAGQRYPKSEYVDVVNEALHAPASYRNALGGSGSTGWDWIVWSFEQARKYFPNSKLLINDYGIISDTNAATNYAKIINILKSKGLIDGIGIQCHYFNMNTVSTSTMKNVLNILGATGLPIYVSELDMNGDDSTQLARYKEKFPILWESPYVKGVTIWGYIQGQTWADGTHLVTSSGSERPALTWLKQYINSTEVPPTATPKPTATLTPTPIQTVKPTATPAPKYGDVNGDGAINSLDSAILKRYLLGTSINISVKNADVNLSGTVDLIDQALLNKYLLGLISSLPVGSVTPTPTPTSTPTPTPSSSEKSILVNNDFETGNTQGWSSMGPASLAIDNTEKNSGSYSLKVTNRTGTWQGAAQSVLGKLVNGTTYNISAWVKLNSSSSDEVKVTLKSVIDGQETYETLATSTVGNSWTQLKGTYVYNVSGEPTELTFYIEGPASGVDFYVDDVMVTNEGSTVVTPTPTPTSTPVLPTPTPTNTPSSLNIPWNWTGIIGTGQSLSVGANPILSTTQRYNNLKLYLGNLTVPPYDANNSALKMVPLVEPIRSLATSFPSAYPKNLYGETPHTSMADQITTMVKSAGGADYITAHTVVGESGQGISVIKKGATDTGTTGHSYAASIFEVTAINRLAKAAGKTYGVGGITLIHGETDCGNPTYESDIHKLWSDYNQDIKSITGQTQNIPMFLVQQHSYPSTGTSASTLAQWKAGVDYPGDIVCIGPNYQRYYGSDHVHLISSGYQQLGEKFGQVYYERVVLGHDWQPLQPTSATKSGRVITVNFHVPTAPLVWDSTLPAPNQSSQTEWKNGKGFEVTANGARVTISSVEISGNSVKITCASDLPTSGVNVGYAFTGGTERTNGSYRWGLLRDSDPFKGSVTGVSQPNFCLAFQMAAN